MAVDKNERRCWYLGWCETLDWSQIESIDDLYSYIPVERSDALKIAESALEIFVQNNWYGPVVDLKWEQMQQVNDIEKCQLILSDIVHLKHLSVDTVPVYELCITPGLLHLCCLVVFDEKMICDELLVVKLKLNVIKTRQAILDEPSISLKNLFIDCLRDLEKHLEIMSLGERVLIYSQLCTMSFAFYMHVEGTQFLEKALECACFELKFAGELGVNTKFQTEPLSQLFVKINTQAVFQSKYSADMCSNLPKNKALDDDTLLPETKFVNPEVTELPELALEQQVAVCLKLYHHLKHIATDTSTTCERKAIVNCLLKMCPKFYPVQFYALFQRCALEGSHYRYLDRLLMQMENLQECYTVSCDENHKSVAFFALPWPTKWQTEKQYADILIELGCTATALELYLKLQMWDVAAGCYVRLDRKTEGTQLISDQLKTKPTPKLWCLLGDLTCDVSCYHNALQMTQNKFSRAYKSLGAYYCGQKKMDVAIEYFEKALELNSLQPLALYTLSCCAMTLEKWSKAQNACQKFVNLEPENAQGWNNLGAIFLKLKDRTRAQRAFAEATKHSYDNWQIWENFLYTSIDLGLINDSMRAFTRILEVKQDRMDVEALQRITVLVIRSKEKLNSSDWLRAKSAFMFFMGSVTSKVSTKYEVWECYADVCQICAHECEQDREKAVKLYMKAVRHLTNTPKVEVVFDVFWKCVEKSEKFLAAFEEYAATVTDNVEKGDGKIQLEADVKSELLGCLNNLKNFYQLESLFFEFVTPSSEQFVEKLTHCVTELEQKLKHF